MTAGENLSVLVSLTDYAPADGWSLSYRFSAPSPITSTATTEGSGFRVNLSNAQTLTFPSGQLRFDALVTKSSGDPAVITEAVSVDSGVIAVTASPLFVSKWAAVLTSVDAAISTWGTSDQRSMTIEGMSVSYRSIDELLKLRAFCVMQIGRETGNRRPSIIRARFNVI